MIGYCKMLFLCATLGVLTEVTMVASSGTGTGFLPFLTFKDGMIGANFFGFKVSAGLGGSRGMQAEAETPFGQTAGAGLDGRPYAGATAGGGANANANVEGKSGPGASNGQNDKTQS